MKKIIKLIMLVFILNVSFALLSACKKEVDLSKLTCQDDPTGQSDAEKRAIGDACFRGGHYTKSEKESW